MKAILWSDNHNFPSLPLMKISTYYKKQGVYTKLLSEEDKSCDILIKSKAFGFTPDPQDVPKADKVIQGGSGYAIHIEDGKEIYNKEADPFLPPEIESQYPDYSLYPEYSDTAYGFLTRGCCNDCSFCIVSKKEGRCSKKVADLSDFWRGQNKIELLDGNLLACKDREILLQQLIKSKTRINYNQGLDARFITDDIARLVCQTKIDMLHFAFDFMKNEKAILKGLEIFKKHTNKTDRSLRVYVLTNYDTTHEEDWYRVRRIRELGYQPYIMIYQKGTHDRFITDLARWNNSYYLNRSVDFADYVPRKDGKSCKQLYASIIT